jgi:heptosyltransferase-1
MAGSFLIVRLGALGDLVHALPAVAALRATWPDARIDWLVDARYRSFLAFVTGVDGVVIVGAKSTAEANRPESKMAVVRRLRRARYDCAIDLQGLVKSAAFARLSGAREAVGFASPQLRERLAGLLYSRQVTADNGGHVIRKNLSLVEALGATVGPAMFPLNVPASPRVAEGRALMGLSAGARFAMLIPGAGWPNKQWPAERFGEVAVHLRDRHRLPSLVLWGPGDRLLADRVCAASAGAAVAAPPTSIGDLLALAKEATIVVGGDTGPMQLAAAVGTPLVGVFGPTNPARNGPWAVDDRSVSRFEACECHHKRRCRRPTPCVDTITTGEVAAAVDARLERAGAGG